MEGQLPTSDEFFSTAADKKELPSADEFFAPPKPSAFGTTLNAVGEIAKDSLLFRSDHTTSNEAVQNFIKNTSVGRVMDAFGHGFSEPFEAPIGIEPGGETEKELQRNGILNNYVEGENNFRKAVIGGLVTSSAAALDAALMRAPMAMFGGVGEATIQAGRELPYHLGEPLKGIGEIIREPQGAIGVTRIYSTPRTPVQLRQPKSLGVLDSEAAYFGTKEPSATMRVAQAEEAVPATAPEEISDIHKVARNTDPETFSVYDRLSITRDNLRNQLAEISASRTADLDTQIMEIQEAKEGKFGKLQSLQEKRAEILASDTPEMVDIRKKLQETDYQMRDLAPKVSEAYRVAEDQLPKQETVSPQLEETKPAETIPGKPIEDQYSAIVSDISSKLVSAGRPPEEANAAAQLIAEHYKAIAERGWTKGTPEEIYNRDMANIKSGKVRAVEFAQKDQEIPSAESSSGLSGEPLSQRSQTSSPGIQEPSRQTSERNFPSGVFTTRPTVVPSTKEGGVSISRVATDGSYHKVDNLQQIKELASKSEPDFHNFLKEIVQQTVGTELASIRLKDAKSLENKLNRVQPHKIGDYLGGRIIADSPDAIQSVLDKLRSHATIQNIDDFTKSGRPTGYRAIHVQILGDNGISAEIQIQPREIAEVTKRGHALYKEWQDANRKGETEKALEIKKQAKDIYDEAWKKWEDRTANTLEQFAKGKIRLATDEAKATITLMKSADASTFIHETGHHWLDEMMRYAKAEDAPENLKNDVSTVRKWLGVEEGDEISRRQHEKFARGFERYLMEGTAPSRQLASVFAKFKQWLTKIYQTVERLRSPISDDIRDVFDRLLSSKPEKTVLAPEHEPGAMLANIHEADAIHTPAEKAHEVADNIRAEIKSTATQHDPEIADAISTAETTGSGVNRPGSEPIAPETAGETSAQAPSEVSAGGKETAGEGPKPRAKPVEPKPKPEYGSDNLPESANTILGKPKSDLVDKAGNIRLDNLNTPEDVNNVLRQTSDEFGGFTAMRRGVISDAQAIELADALGMEAAKLNMRKIGEAFNSEQIIAARKLLIQSATEVRDFMNKAATGSDEDVMAYAEAKARHMMIQEQVSGITAEAGRALRAFKKLEGAEEAQATTDFLKQATGKDLFQLKKEAQLGASLDTAEKVSKFIQDSRKASFTDMLMEYWINALLSGPQTHITNMLSNTLVSLYSVPETFLTGVVGKLLGSGEHVELGEAKARLFGIVQGAQDGVKAAWSAFKNEESTEGAVKLEQRRFQAIPSAKVNIGGKELELGGKQIRIPGRLLTAEDEFFKTVARRQELNALAYRQAVKDGLQDGTQDFAQRIASIIQNPTEEMMKQAGKAADYQTFTNELGAAGQGVQRFANSHPLFKLIIPFIRTPVNIVKYAGERSVLGLFSGEVRANLAGLHGEMARDTKIARIALGTTIGITAISLASQGLITGGGPTDSKKRALLYVSGWQPYSFKIGEGYYSYARLEPLGTLVGIPADMYEIGHAMEEADISKVAGLFLSSVSKNLVNKTWLQGPSDLINAVTDHERYGDQYIQNMLSTVVPTGLGQIARTEDPYMREARGLLDGIKAKIPGISSTLLPKRDIWGQPIQKDGSFGPDLLSPIYYSAMKNDPVNKRLLSLGYSPSKPDRKIRGVQLTDKQYDDYSRLSGTMSKMRLDQLIANPGFSNVPEKAQIDVIKKIIDTARETARSLVLMQNPELIKQASDIKIKALQKQHQ